MDHSTRRFIGVTRQFLALVRQLKKDLRKYSSDLNSALHKQTEAIRKSNDAKNAEQRKSPEITTLVHAPESIEVHQSADDTSHERSYKNRTVFISALSLTVLTFYASLVYLQWREMIAATGAAQQAVVEARNNRLQSDKVFRATVEQFHLEQRAWLACTESIPAIESGKAVNFTVSVMNAGKTFAKNVVIHSYITFSDRELVTEKALLARRILGTVDSAALIAPGPVYTSPTKLAAEETPKILAVLGRAGYTYIWGEASYSDVFENPHMTMFCAYQSVKSDVLLQCKFHNDAD
jgi:hypothetical protein